MCLPFLPLCSLFCCALRGCFLARKFGKLKKLDCFAVDGRFFFPYTSLTVTLLPLTFRFLCCRAGGGRKFILFLLKINTLHCSFSPDWNDPKKLYEWLLLSSFFSSSWMWVIYRISTGCVEMKPRIVIPLGDGRWSRRSMVEERLAVIVGYLSPLI